MGSSQNASRDVAQVFREHASLAYRVALAAAGSPEDAEDAVQDAFLGLLRAPGALDPGGNPRAYVARAAANAARMIVRGRARRTRREEAAPPTEGAMPPSEIERREELAAVRGALAALPPEERLPLGLRFVEGFSLDEAAGALDLPRSTVDKRTNRALESLRRALSAAGFAATAPAALLAALPRPEAPAGLTGKLGALAAQAQVGSAAAAPAAKGGMAVKVIAGVILAGALAGIIGLIGPIRPMGSPPAKSEPVKGPPKIEHLAWCAGGHTYPGLDGPRFEAMAPERPGPGASDEAGNVWFGGRCLDRTTGLITRVFGDEYWDTYFPLSEGPASAFSNFTPSAGYGQSSASYFLVGSPFEGPDKGCIYFGNGAEVKKVWKNAEKGGRWWFKRLAGGGNKPAPQTKGQSVPALEAQLKVDMVQVMPDGRLIVFGGGSFYECKDGNLVCLLGLDDYKDQNGPKGKNGQLDVPTLGVLGGDGTFYLGTYFSSGYGGASPAVWRVKADGKIEPYAQCKYGSGRDGPGLETGYFCGPHFWAAMHNYKLLPPDCLFLTAHDDAWIRRARDGRVTTLCPDGEWRELANVEKDGLRWFRGWTPGPGGTATVVNDQVSKALTFIVSGIDFAKPTTGPQLGASGETPPEPKKKGR